MLSRPLSPPLAALVLLLAFGAIAGAGAASPAAHEEPSVVDVSPSGPSVAGAAPSGPSGDAALPNDEFDERSVGASAAVSQELRSWNVTWRITLESNGDARWEAVQTFPVEDASDRAAFRDLAGEFERGDHSLGLDAFEQAAENASAVTGREMAVDAGNATRRSELTNGTGALTLRFTWTNFGQREGDRLVVGDAFRKPGGKWLTSIPERWALAIAPPPGYSINFVEAPRVVNQTVLWDGPHTFDGDQPRVVFVGDEPPTPTVTPTPPTVTPTPTTSPPVTPTATSPPGTSPATTTTAGSPDEDGGFPSILAIIGVAALAAMTAALLAVYARRDDDTGLGGLLDRDSGGDGGAAAATAGAGGTDDPAGSTADATAGDDGTTAASDGVDEAAAGGAAASGGAAADDEVDEELLSDEERVERLLERNGGRMKQANIVKETGWSNAKVSQLLSAMDDEDRIDKLRIGRENLISFPDEDVTDFDSE